ncbi:MAG: A/G-specific adenine glycosylase [Clostridiales bacterium]|nr:A/G-specific adenine glycosylase [Clostridiales bacterium]
MENSYDYGRIVRPLLDWYRENKRTLPWRENPSPYRVWVSEIMLQQTRVEAVKEYYVRFMDALPTIEDLAKCDEEKLLKLWEGLGYYSRARNLQKAAREIVLRFDGTFPTEPEDVQSLSGIGAYTTGAICSIAYGQRIAAVDGNVLRVTARLSENATPINDDKYKKELTQKLSTIYPKAGQDCADFTQSLFELGALVCKPQNPDCAVCPLAKYCKARKSGAQKEYPILPQKREKRRESVYVFLIQTDEGFCIRRREKGVLKGMNEFPSHVIERGESAESVLNEWGMYAFTEIKRKKYKHVFTHIVWDITCVWVKAESAPFDCYAMDEIEEGVSLPTAIKQCMDIIDDK